MRTGLFVDDSSRDTVLTVGRVAPVYIDETPFVIVRENGRIVIREVRGDRFVVVAEALPTLGRGRRRRS